jgi:aspartyl/asparaginyl-tRNA synthetase
VHRFFHERQFYWISTPIITTSDAEGAGQMFRVSTLDMANLPRDGKGNVDFSRGLLRQGNLPDRVSASSTWRPTAWR